MKTYFRVRLAHVPSNLEAEVTQLAFQAGCSGISEALAYTQRDLAYDPDILPSRTKELDIFFQNQPGSEFFEALLALAPSVRADSFEEKEQDWLEEWKKGFAPFRLVGPYWVVPSWVEKPAEAEKPIYIDPGMAFGTGTHATTQLAAHLVYKLLSSLGDVKSKSLIDVGTGTAILAILAHQQGVEKVVGIDVDPEARRVARENVERNQGKDIMIFDEPLEEISDTFDIVVANIIDGVLIKISQDLFRVMNPGGYIIVTGILLEREALFLDRFLQDAPVEIERRVAKDEWVGFLMRAKS